MARYRYPIEDEKLDGSSYIKFTVIEENTTGGGSETQPTQTFGDSVLLYTPAGISIGDNIGYGEVDPGVIGAKFAEQLGRGRSAREIARGFASEFNSPGAMDDTSSRFLVQRMVSNLLPALGGGAVGGFVGGNLGAAIGAGAGIGLSPEIISQLIGEANQRAVNPNTKVLFERVSVRSFSFTFIFIPTSRQEAETVKTIVKLFRSNMYPEIAATQFGQPYLYKYPTKFSIVINPDSFTGPDLSEGAENIIQFKPCFLETSNVTYNPNSMAWHADGNPVETQISLTFKESETLTREDVEAGF